MKAIAVALTPLENITATLPALRVWHMHTCHLLCVATHSRRPSTPQYVLDNASPGASFYQAVNASHPFWRESSRGLRDVVTSISTAVFAAIVAVVTGFTFAVIVPSLVLIDRARNEYLGPFLQSK